MEGTEGPSPTGGIVSTGISEALASHPRTWEGATCTLPSAIPVPKPLLQERGGTKNGYWGGWLGLIY